MAKPKPNHAHSAPQQNPELKHWQISKSGEEISERMQKWIAEKQRKLKRGMPPGEKAFAKIVAQLGWHLPQWKSRLWFTQQKVFIVSNNIVFFGDFMFKNMNLLVEIDGKSHGGAAARERDNWRSQVIALWKCKVVRIHNDDVMSRHFSETEAWFIEQAANHGMPAPTGNQLVRDYLRMKERCRERYEPREDVTKGLGS